MLSFIRPAIIILQIAALLNVQVASLPVSDLVVLENLTQLPPGWSQEIEAPPNQRLRFRIAVKQENAWAFEDHVVSISTPGHVLYGHHMRQDELRRMLRPSPKATISILNWLKDENVPDGDIEDEGDWINFYVSTSEAEKILATKFYFYSNAVSHAKKVRTLQYSVPKNVSQYIHMIQPTTRFGETVPQRSSLFSLGSAKTPLKPLSPDPGFDIAFCNKTTTLQCLKDLYNIGDYKAKFNKANRIGVAGFLNDGPKLEDYAQFTKKYAPYVRSNSFEYVTINGARSLQDAYMATTGEGNLDTQYAFSLSYPASGTYYNTGGLGSLVVDLDMPTQQDNQNEPYLDFLHYILALPDDQLPTTLSTSYGENEQSVPKPYANRTCNLFAQLGARGVSVVFSSGDSGVGVSCQTNDGKNTTRFNPVFPATCPFVTSVGGTNYIQPEQASTFSGGGFSDIFPRPPYQDDAVTQYLGKIGDKWRGLYNSNGRGFPDVSAQAAEVPVVERGKEDRAFGTSASAPVFAAIVSLLNGARIESGQRPLGFLNPFIYSVGFKGLTDIILGGSTGCPGFDVYSNLTSAFVPYASWNATEGWDPVTGYGTPNFRKLLELSNKFVPRSAGKYRLKFFATNSHGSPRGSYGAYN